MTPDEMLASDRYQQWKARVMASAPDTPPPRLVEILRAHHRAHHHSSGDHEAA